MFILLTFKNIPVKEMNSGIIVEFTQNERFPHAPAEFFELTSI